MKKSLRCQLRNNTVKSGQKVCWIEFHYWDIPAYRIRQGVIADDERVDLPIVKYRTKQGIVTEWAHSISEKHPMYPSKRNIKLLRVIAEKQIVKDYRERILVLNDSANKMTIYRNRLIEKHKR